MDKLKFKNYLDSKYVCLVFTTALALALCGCSGGKLADQYGAVVILEDLQFKDVGYTEEFDIRYDKPVSITVTNSPIVRAGLPTTNIVSIAYKRDLSSKSQGGNIIGYAKDTIMKIAELAAGAF